MIGEKLAFSNAGCFVSRGRGRHCTRVISSWELIFVKSGVLSIREEERCYSVSSGEYLLLRPGRQHGGTCDYPPSLTFFWGHFTGADELVEDLPPCGRVARPGWMSEYYALLLNAQNESDNAVACNLLMRLLLNELSQPRKEDGNPAKYLAWRARRMLALNYAEAVSTADIAAALRCNPDYLGRVFREVFGRTMIDELNRVRCGHAAELLRNSTGNIGEIACRCGYNDEAYFRRRFQRLFAMPPGEYRNLHAVGHTNSG